MSVFLFYNFYSNQLDRQFDYNKVTAKNMDDEIDTDLLVLTIYNKTRSKYDLIIYLVLLT